MLQASLYTGQASHRGDEMTKLCIDLCSGLGGFSQAFVDAGWEVITVDIEPKFKPTICADVQSLRAFDIIEKCREQDFGRYQEIVVLMSPPCNATSRANPNAWLRTIGSYLRIAASCTDIARDLIQAKGHGFFGIEQPDGRAHWFYGSPTFIVNLGDYGKATKKRSQVWTNIPMGLLPKSVVWKLDTHKARKDIHKNEKEKTSAQKAAIPLQFSQAILEATEGAEAATTEGAKP